MKTQLKDGIWIEGFDNYVIEDVASFNNRLDKLDNKVIYSGKTSEISEELAKKCVDTYHHGLEDETWTNYSGFDYYCFTPKESIKSACSQDFCIIYKIK